MASSLHVILVVVGVVAMVCILEGTQARTLDKRSVNVLPEDELADRQLGADSRSRLAAFLQWLSRGDGDYSSELPSADKRAQYKRVKPCYWSLVSCYKKKRDVRSAMRAQQPQGPAL